MVGCKVGLHGAKTCQRSWRFARPSQDNLNAHDLNAHRRGAWEASASLEGSPEERVRRLLRIGGEIGWGEFALERLTATELAVSVRRSPVAESYGPSAAPVCHLIRGVLESLATVTFGRPAAAMETACVAMGAPVCRFVVS